MADQREADAVHAELLAHGHERRHLAEVRGLHDERELEFLDGAGRAPLGQEIEVAQQAGEIATAAHDGVGIGLGGVDRNLDRVHPALELAVIRPGALVAEDAVGVEPDPHLGQVPLRRLQHVAVMLAGEGIAVAR